MKVLLVEADAALRESLASFLVSDGISVLKAGNATEALSLVHAIGHHDILIIDHGLRADISGFDLAGRIRERRPLAPLILLCSQSHVTPVFAIRPSDRLLAMPLGAGRLLLLIRQIAGVDHSVDAASDTIDDEDGVRGCHNAVRVADSGDAVHRNWSPGLFGGRCPRRDTCWTSRRP